MKKKTVLIIASIALVFYLSLFGLGLYAYSLGYYHAIRGGMVEDHNRDQAILFFKKAYNKNPDAYMVAHDIACCYSVKNDKQEAVKWLKLTLKTSYAEAARKWAKTEDDFDNIRDDPEFQSFIDGTLSLE